MFVNSYISPETSTLFNKYLSSQTRQGLVGNLFR
jgi:hypothetical protein